MRQRRCGDIIDAGSVTCALTPGLNALLMRGFGYIAGANEARSLRRNSRAILILKIGWCGETFSAGIAREFIREEVAEALEVYCL